MTETQKLKKVKVLSVVFLISFAVLLFAPVVLHAVDDPGEPIYDTGKSWWNDGKVGVGLATAGIVAGGVGLLTTHKPMAFIIPAIGGTLLGSAFGLGSFIFNIGKQIFP